MSDGSTEGGAPADGRLVILMRHGIAVEKSDAIPDEQRRLTSRGLRRVRSAAKGLRVIAPSVTAVYTSPAIRCIETALAVADRYGQEEVESIDSLSKDGSIEEVIELLKEFDHDAIVIGHEPNLSNVLRELLAASDATPLELKKAGAAAFRIDGAGVFRLEWVATPLILRRIRRH